jgi:hypothetical protein
MRRQAFHHAIRARRENSSRLITRAARDFGCRSGETHVCDDTGKTVVEVIKIDACDLSGRLMPSGPEATK